MVIGVVRDKYSYERPRSSERVAMKLNNDNDNDDDDDEDEKKKRKLLSVCDTKGTSER